MPRVKQPKQVIANVYLWPQNMVMVFDETGQQIAKYQKPDEATKFRILTDAPETALFHVGEYRGQIATVSRDAWRSFAGLDIIRFST